MLVRGFGGKLNVLAGEQAKEEKMKESDLTGRFIAKIKTRTRLIFTTDTTTVPYTCATFSSAVCRRRRRFQRQTIEDLEEKLDERDSCPRATKYGEKRPTVLPIP
ncbi:hypothetical protein E2C01_036836 [Portunus trituberculatus]|uniref:Uncharacterized protein n=1 Tax=Portunus trituberculatus TaxID=210409 RepID=A0A5B7FD18_PORTR|nr:hypothetical protein [Portunus trituberculatus]